DPGILLLAVPAGEGGLGLSDPGVESLSSLIVGVGYIFADGIAKLLVRCGLERMHAGDVSIHDGAAGKIISCARAVQRQIGDGEVVGYTLANLEPLGIHGGEGADVDEVDLVDELHNLVQQHADHLQTSHAESTGAIQVDGIGHAPDRQVLNVRRLPSQNSNHLQSFALI